MTAGTQEVVIATKLFAPSPRHEPVSRPRLYARLRNGLGLPLTLVVAPAGWGKSTLVSGWLRREDITTGWVSLDPGDDDVKQHVNAQPTATLGTLGDLLKRRT